jgi:hypothetical protein
MFRTKNRPALVALFAFGFFTATFEASADISASVNRPDSESSQYVIKVSGFELERSLAKDISRYVIFNPKGDSVPVINAKTPGFSRTTKSVELSGPFKPNTQYKMNLKLSDEAPVSIEVKPFIEEQTSQNAPFFAYVNNHGRFKVEPMVGDSAKGLGVKLNVGIGLGNFGISGLFGDLELEGEIATDSDDEDFSQTVRGDLEFKYYLPALKLDSPVTGKRRAYPLAFRIAPAGFESDQEFDLLDFKTTAQFAAAVPYTESIGQLLGNAFGSTMKFVPMQILTGYTYVKDVEDKDGLQTFDVTNRWDSEIAWAFPLTKAVELEFRYKSYLDIAGGDHKDRYFGTLKYGIDEENKRAITLSYKSGGDAPTFNGESAFRIGFDMKLGTDKK